MKVNLFLIMLTNILNIGASEAAIQLYKRFGGFCINKNNYFFARVIVGPCQDKYLAFYINNFKKIESDIINDTNINDLIDAIKEKNIYKSRIAMLEENLNHQTNLGYTALMFAVIFNSQEIVKSLIKSDADINVQNYDGKTALMLAIEMGYTDIAKLLMNYHAQLDLKDIDGNTAQIIAKTLHNKIVFKLIENKIHEECPICCEEVHVDMNNFIPLSCQHLFHKTCLNSWIKECLNKKIPITCPICRQLLPEDIK